MVNKIGAVVMSKKLGFGLALGLLFGCGEDQLILDGERFDLRTDISAAEAAGIASGDIPAFAAPAQVNHDAWTHRGGSVSHKLTHPALGAGLDPIWTANIGQGNARKARITADPIVAGGRIFTMDSGSRVTATGTDGNSLWSRALIPSTERGDEASGGGLAYGDGIVIATTGFGELFALDATSGEIQWRQWAGLCHQPRQPRLGN